MDGLGIALGQSQGPCQFTCGVESELLPDYQRKLNVVLSKKGLTEVPITGKYDAFTSGATWWFHNRDPQPTYKQFQNLQPETCRKSSYYQYPCPGMVVPKPKGTDEQKVSTAGIAGIIGALALVTAAAYAMTR